LASSTTYLYAKLESLACASDAADSVSARPDGAILCYAVISAVNLTHPGSIANLLGPEFHPVAKDLLALSGECNVHPEMPPIFLWHTVEDASVPVENSLHFAEALQKAHIPFGLKIYPLGRHGMGLAESYRDTRQWPEEAADFFRTLWENR